MPPNPKNFIKFLSPIDNLRVRFESKNGKIYRFSLQYEALIDGKWHIIMRMDNVHQSLPHKHIYYLHKTPIKTLVSANPHTAFRENFELIKVNYLKIKDNYLLVE